MEDCIKYALRPMALLARLTGLGQRPGPAATGSPWPAVWAADFADLGHSREQFR
ncbi:MAG: hypothetical protein NZ700_10330 [Gemmataceae bacterium]|nr:hypothetical protein [Gemmataceae bacterium]MDW8265165.1 hypothetical protein [Gemmataceae bacterium]